MQSAEIRLQHEIVGLTCHGRQGNLPNSGAEKLDTRGKRELMLQKIRRPEEESRNQQMVTMSTQGAWLKWDAVTEKKISWSEIWKSTGYALKFRISSVYDLLPTPANLQSGGRRMTQHVLYVGKEPTWNISFQVATSHYNKEDTGGATTRYSRSWPHQ